MSASVSSEDAAAPELRNVRLLLVADAEPGLLPRVLEVLAKRGLVPDSFHVAREGDALEMAIAMAEMPAEMVHVIEGNLGQIVGVRSLTRTVISDVDAGVRIAA